MAAEFLPPQEVLRQLLEYDPDTGALTWKARLPSHFTPRQRFSAEARCNMWNGKHAGKPAFDRVSAKGYCVGVILEKWAPAHRVIWKLVYGTEPPTVDHIDGDGTGNRLANLRAATHADQAKNQSTPRQNRSGYIGVSAAPYGRWKAQIGVRGKQVYLGSFASPEEASQARKAAEVRFGFHANHGRGKIVNQR